MKFSRDSWLFKFHKMMDTKVYWRLRAGGIVSLCELFWSTVGITILFTFFAILALFVLMVLGMGLVGLVSLLTETYIDGFPYMTTFYTLGVFFFIASVLLATLWEELEVYPNWWPKKLRIKKSIKENKPSGLIVSFLKAKKAKLCPLVKLED